MFSEILEDVEEEDLPQEVWVTNRQRLNTENKLKKLVYPDTEKIFAFDRVMSVDPGALKRGTIGKVKIESLRRGITGSSGKSYRNRKRQKGIFYECHLWGSASTVGWSESDVLPRRSLAIR
jgi:hypothetical protein